MHEYTIQKFRGGYAVCFTDREGKRRRYALKGQTKAAATPEALEIVTEFFRLLPDEVRVRDIWQKYLSELKGRPAEKRMKYMTELIAHFGDYKPRQINSEMVDQYMAKRKNLVTGAPISNETFWTELGALRDSIRWAGKQRLIRFEDIPFIKRPPKQAPRDRPLSREEVSSLLNAAKDTQHLYLALLLLLGTAGRVTAILELTWDRVDFANSTIDLRLSTKTPRKGRAKVPMNPFLKEELLKWKEISDSDHVISWAGKPILAIKTAFSNAREKAGLVDVRTHDLRHTAAVWMLAAGSSIQRISQYLGHTTLEQTFKVYARYQPDHLRAEAVTCHGIFPPSSIRVCPNLRTDNEAHTIHGRTDHRHSYRA